MTESKVYYCYRARTNELCRYEVTNPNHTRVRNSLGGVEVDLDESMRESFVFEDGILETDIKAEQDFLDCFVENRQYKCKNGRMFKPWLSVVEIRTDKKKDEKETKTVVETVQKVVIPETAIATMKIDEIKAIMRSANLADMATDRNKAELIQILKDNGNLI